VMRLAEAGKLDLDAPLVDVLPEFRVADPEVTRRVTPRHLLTHTSGIAGEHFEDTGRGDDALERYVESCADLGQDVPLGATMSYCNTGYCILGRVIERLTDSVWDAAMREWLFEPLGLTHTVTLPEDALRFRTAWGHTQEPGEAPVLAPYWEESRSLGPAGAICATASDALRFARLHLDGGVAEDGTRLLSPESVAEMLRVHVDVAEPWATGAHWGLGWILDDWGGRRVVGHDGNTVGQNAYLHLFPDRRVAIALFTNVASAVELSRDVYGGLARELCGVEMPTWPQPAADGAPAAADVVGSYERYGIRIDVEAADGGLQATAHVIEPLASQVPEDSKPTRFEVRPSTAGERVFVARREGDETWWPLVFFDIEGERYAHVGARAQRKVS
jgi:CubicO group peptidase (beta-lactamase class C family)